jgi:hypothetical protein
MIGESRIDEWFLSLQGLHRAAARSAIVIERRIDQFWKEFRDGAQAGRRTPVHPVPWLTEHELAARRVVPEIQPIVNRASLSARFFGNQFSRAATVDTPDHNIDAVQARSGTKMVRYSAPIQVPEEIETRCEDHCFRMSDFGLAEWLPDAICRRNQVAIHYGHVQSSRVASDEHRLMQVRETSHYRAAVSAAADYKHPYWAAKQLARNVVRHGSPSLLLPGDVYNKIRWCRAAWNIAFNGGGLHDVDPNNSRSPEYRKKEKMSKSRKSMHHLHLAPSLFVLLVS